MTQYSKKTIVAYWISIVMFLMLNPLLLNAARADDIDLFKAASNTVDSPNVLIILDTSANWNTRFSEEISALASVVNSLTNSIKVGLMMYLDQNSSTCKKEGPECNKDGGYVRFRVQQIIGTNETPGAKAGLVAIINNLNNNGKGGDAGSNSTPSMIMNEAYRYFAGIEVGSHLMETDLTKRDDSALDGGGSKYKSPIDAGSCAKNYIIYISNGKGENNSEVSTATYQLKNNFGGDVTPVLPSNKTDSAADLYARFMYLKDPPPPPTPSLYHPFSKFPGAYVITYTIEIDPANNDPNANGKKADLYFTNLLKSMATQGNGKYFPVMPGNDKTVTVPLTNALNNIFNEIQAVNNTFASAALPVNAGVQGTFLNQVYIGSFRPVEGLSPLWLGNLKQYQFKFDADTGTLFLADSVGAAAASSNTGFVQPNAISFWTNDSDFWSFHSSYYLTNGNGSSSTTCPSGGPASDCPDGPWVEKGGVAQRLRTLYPGKTPDNSPTNRPIYICNASVTSLTACSTLSTPFSSLDCDALGLANATECTNLKNWIYGEDNQKDENQNSSSIDIRASIHGDVLHSQPAVIDFGGSTGVWAFYGSNDGIFHAVKGGQDDCTTPTADRTTLTARTCPGTEQWGFIAPEFYSRLKRLRDQSPYINMPSLAGDEDSPINIPSVVGDDRKNKPYFMDGPIGIYKSGSTVYIFPTMRRGGRSIYALNVTTPSAPSVLWRKSYSDTGFSELGQTWSKPIVTKLGASSHVLVFGAGYDAAVEDGVSGATRSMGRGIFILNMTDGSIINSFGPSDGIEYSIPGNVTPVDTDGDGYADRFYAADTGGNIWRIKYANNTWSKPVKLAALGGETGNPPRKFLFGPDVISYDKSSSKYAVLIGSGDREKPFNTTITNRFYMLIDDGSDNLINESSLADASSGSVTLTDTQKGWYITLGTGEKVIGESIAVAGRVVFGTNKPTSTSSSTYPGTNYPICTGNLGEARRYAVNYKTAGSTDILANTSSKDKRSQIAVGGGFLPSPMAGKVQIAKGDGTMETHVFIMDNPANPGGVMKITVNLDPIRNRIYWYKEKID